MDMDVILGHRVKLNDLVKVTRGHAKVSFSEEFKQRVVKCRKLVEKLSDNEQVAYGITTGLGDNCDIFISKEDREIIQVNTLRSHATALGEPLNEECVRAIMFTMLQAFGSGYTGIRLETLDLLKELLNTNIIPYCPKHGSVGYLSVEANIGLVLIGEGKAYFNNELLSGMQALKKAGLKPTKISTKEGLTLISGTSAATALTSLALYDGIVLAKTTDISGAMSLEVLKGNLKSMDERLMSVRPHVHQGSTASNIRKLLEDSEIIKKYEEHRVQDALSLRCIPQVHGAVKKSLNDALITIETELNSSLDNPQVFENDHGEGEVIMGCNADATYIGLAADSLTISLTTLAKITERRVDRMINRHVSELPSFLTFDKRFNNGLMIGQYTAAGILGEMRILSHPATIDNVTTSALQEDYVSMGYNAALKAYQCVELGRYITATEIFNACQAQDFYKDINPASATKAVHDMIREKVEFVSKDRVTYSEIEYIARLIKNETIIKVIEQKNVELHF
jgi:histidine ammonia-lyase